MSITVKASNYFDTDEAIYAFRNAQDVLVHQETGHTADGKYAIYAFTEALIKSLKADDKGTFIQKLYSTSHADLESSKLVMPIVYKNVGAADIDQFILKFEP